MKTLLASFFILTSLLWAGCGKQQQQPQSDAGTTHLHVALPPHGGTPLALGDDYQIEWFFDAAAGKLQAYVLDGEMENFVRITQQSFDVTAQLPGREEVLHFMAIPNAATGETVGNTSQFEAQADWLKTNPAFTADIQEIGIQETNFTNVPFVFPKGK